MVFDSAGFFLTFLFWLNFEKDRLDEAERFMFETMKIDRYESRLRVLSYIGFFDELMLTVNPQIEAVINASKVLLTSKRFKKVLEV